MLRYIGLLEMNSRYLLDLIIISGQGVVIELLSSLKIKNNNRKIVMLLLLPFVLSMLFSTLTIQHTQGHAEKQIIVSQDNILSPQTYEPKSYDYEWVVMVYLDGDNNLEAAAIDDLNELEAGLGSSTDIKIIVLIDRADGYDTTNGDWTEARMYEVVSDETSTIASTLLSNEGELNMGHQDVLDYFINYTYTNYNGDKYWLNIWNHGGGIDGICWDDSTTSDKLTMEEMQVAIQNNIDEHGISPTIISHDACFMNMIEVAYEFKDQAEYFIASEESIPEDGFDYDTIITDLIADATMDASELSEVIVDAYESQYSTVSSTTLSAINLSKMDLVAQEISHFAGNLSIAITGGDGGAINEAFLDTQFFYDYFIVDLVHFVENIQANTTLMGAYSDLSTSATNLQSALAELIVYNYQHSVYSSDANGITIFMPMNTPVYEAYIQDYLDVADNYALLDWQSDVLWDEFLDDFYTADFGIQELDYEELDLGVATGTTAISSDEDHYYQYTIPDYGIYQITAQILSGDADLYIFDGFTLALIAYSQFYNPSDGSSEAVQMHFSPGTIIINMYGFEASSYDLMIQEVTPTTIVLGDDYEGSSGTQEGDDDHYSQVYNFYYEYTFDVVDDYYLVLTYDTYDVDFDLYVLSETFTLIDSSDTTSDTDEITLEITETVTYIICIYAYSGHGSFTFTMFTGEDTGENGGLLPSGFISGYTTIIGIISLVAIGAFALRNRRKI
jgi:hypothetical protein